MKFLYKLALFEAIFNIIFTTAKFALLDQDIAIVNIASWGLLFIAVMMLLGYISDEKDK